MKKLILTAIIIGATLLSCNQRQIPLFGEERFIHFTDTTTMVLSFAVLPGETQTELKVPLRMIGLPQSGDLGYEVAVVTEGDNKTTLSSQSYVLPAAPTFRGGSYKDTLVVQFNRTSDLKDAELRLTLELKSNANYSADYRDLARKQILVSDKLVRPEWWTNSFAATYLGPYSDAKYVAFIEATGEHDLSGLDVVDLGSYVRMFVYWLRAREDAGETVYEADGVTKVEDSITYANV